SVHFSGECRIHKVLNMRVRPETGRELNFYCPGLDKAIPYFVVKTHIGPSESVDRLFRISNDEQLPRNHLDLMPIADRRIGRGEQHQYFSLQWFGVLDFVHKEMGEPSLQVT